MRLVELQSFSGVHGGVAPPRRLQVDSAAEFLDLSVAQVVSLPGFHGSLGFFD